MTVAAIALVEAALWAIGVEPGDYWEDPYVGFASYTPHFVADREDSDWLMVAPSKENVLNPQRFRKVKPEGTYRVICFGGSTVYGRPFYDDTSFAGWLRELLPAADPSRNWEVINAGAISYASYRVAGLVEELCQYEPDLVVVYTGHNEFLERRTYERLAERPALFTNSLALVNRLRTITVIRDTLDISGIRKGKSRPQSVLDEKVRAIPVRSVGPEAYHRDEEWAQGVVSHFEVSLTRIVEMARGARAEVLVIVPASNLANFAPFKSECSPGLSPVNQRSLQTHLDQAQQSIEAGDFDGALGHVAAAESLDDRYAHLSFLKGRALLSIGRFDEARTAFEKAREEDVCPLRANKAIVDVVRRAGDRSDVVRLDFDDVVRENSHRGLPGRSMFHDHVHLTLAANQLVAEQILTTLISAAVVNIDGDLDRRVTQSVAERIRGRIDRSKHAGELRKLSGLLMALGQADEARWQAELSLELSGRTPAALNALAFFLLECGGAALAEPYFRDSVQKEPASDVKIGLSACLLENGKPEEVERILNEIVQINPESSVVHELLGDAKLRLGEVEDAIAHLKEAVRLDPQLVRGRFLLATCLESVGDLNQAQSLYQTVLQLSPDHEETRVRLERISHHRGG